MKQFNNKTIKVSIIIITRNRGNMLNGCLGSLVKQTRLPDEVIIVDNASTDNTKKVIAHYSSRESRAESRESREVNNEAMKQLNNQKLYIRYVYEKQIGIPFARNRGIKETKGSLILMLDDDCIADKDWVENMISAHIKHPKAWVIQGRTFSLPKGLYSLAVELSRLLYVRNSMEKTVSLRSFLKKYLTEEIEISMCETKNFSIKTHCLKKHKLLFDTNFYRGEDTDLGRQILKKSGIIIFYPNAKLYHFERSTLSQFLQQQWHIGRTNAKLESKWGGISVKTKMSWSENLTVFPLFCKVNNFREWHKMPTLILLILLDKIFRVTGYFFEKRMLSFKNIGLSNT